MTNPRQRPAFRTINWNGPATGEPVFVPGHPGTTDRLLTVAQLQRTAKYIHFWLLRNTELRGRLIQFSKQSPEHASMVADDRPIENSIKVRRKQLDALLDERLMARKTAEEDRAAREGRQMAGRMIHGAAGTSREARERDLSFPYVFIEQRAGFNSQLYTYAMALVRAASRAHQTQRRAPA